jgi:DNA-binding XRE family transcriptional regulator
LLAKYRYYLSASAYQIVVHRVLLVDIPQHMVACNVGASLYEPINVYKPVGPNIGIVDGPFEYLTVAGIKLPLPFTTRMTVVRLSNGDLFLHSPIKFDERLAKELQKLGAVRHLVSPNQFHYAHIGEWAKAFPETISWASSRVRQRARARHVDVHFTRDLDASAPEEWRGEIDQTLFPGGYFKEFIFFHKNSKTLVLTDTIINIELDKVSEPWRTATKLAGMYHPYGQIFFGMRLPLLLQRAKAGAAIGKIHSWQPQRILLSHGRCFDADADEVIRRIFGEPPH